MVSCLRGDDGESKGAHDDPLAIDHLQQRLYGEEEEEEEEGGDNLEEVDEEGDLKEMGENY